MAEIQFPTSLTWSTRSTYVQTLRSVTIITYTSRSITRTLLISRTTWDVVPVTLSTSSKSSRSFNLPSSTFSPTSSSSSEPSTSDLPSSSEVSSSAAASFTTVPTTSSGVEVAPSSTNVQDHSSSSTGGPPTGTIVTASLCSVAGLALVALLVWIIRRRRRQHQSRGSSDPPQMEIAEDRPPEPRNSVLITNEYGPRISTVYSTPPSSPNSPIRPVSNIPPSLPLDFERGVSVPSMRRPVSELETIPIIQRGISAPSMRRPISELDDTSALSQPDADSRSMTGLEEVAGAAAHVNNLEVPIELEDTSIKSEFGDSKRGTMSSLEGYAPSAIGVRPSSNIHREPTVIEETEDLRETHARTPQADLSASEDGQTTQVFVTPQGSPQRVQKRNQRMGGIKRQSNEGSYSASVDRWPFPK